MADELGSEMEAALAAARQAPEDESLWDELEGLAEDSQRPDEVGALYREVLAGELDDPLIEQLGKRAAQFHEEWFSEDSPHLAEVLGRVLEKQPAADWALSRLTVVLTVGERWTELLELYDRALEAAADDERREQLLDEAAQLAKDFAGAPDRAIDYLERLLEVRPGDSQLVASLERLLERQGRWEALIGLWRQRVASANEADALALRQRIATCYLERLGDPGSCATEVRALLADGAEEAPQLALLERVVAHEAASAEVREGALRVLRARYDDAGRQPEVIEVLGVALAFAEGAEKVALRRELGERCAAAGDTATAMEHYATVLELSPQSEDVQERLAHIAQQSGSHERYAAALVAAADAAGPGPRQVALLVEAGDVRGNDLGDHDGAISLYQRVLEGDARPAVKLGVGRRLEKLLEAAERRSERLAVLEELAANEGDPVERRRILGQCARLAERLEEMERALAFWGQRLEADPQDLEALDALIELSARVERWDLHVETLGRRAEAEVPPVQRRLDLARIAETQASKLGDLDGAIATWEQVQEAFGEDHETVDALFELLVRAERPEQLYALLERAAERDSVRAADVLARVADVCRSELNRLDDAARAYHRAVEMVPSLERAREGLQMLLAEPASAPAAVRGLAKAYQLTDDWQALLDLSEHRLELAAADDERVELLREIASLEEQRAERTGAAFDAIRRALRLAPSDAELARELTRLAELTERIDDAVASLHEAAEASAALKPARATALHRHVAELREQRLEDPAGALSSWLAALALEPLRGELAEQAVRVGAAAGDWSGVAKAAVGLSLARGEFEATLFERAEAVASESGAHAGLAAAVAAEIPAPGEILGALGRALEVRVGAWLSGPAEDDAGAEAALLRALAHERGHVETLRELARLQWKRPGRPLVDTLLSLADAFPDDLDPCVDAARIALDPVADRDLALQLLDRVLRNARRLWERGDAATGERAPDETAVWALDQLVELSLESGDAARAVDLLVDGSRLPVDAERSREMRRRAAELSRERLGDEDRALRLLQSVVDESVEDAEAVAQLGGMLESRGRLPELLALRQRQLALDLEPETRLEVRLEVARVLAAIEAQGGRSVVLYANLKERPGHEPSIEALSSLLGESGRLEELSELLSVQAQAVEAENEVARAASLWARAANLFESELANVDAALRAHRRVVALEPAASSFDALARLHLERGEPAVAAEWLGRRLESASAEERSTIALRLAEAHLAAGHPSESTAVLERTLAEDPAAFEARERLAGLYRDDEAFEALARTLSEGVSHVPDETTRLAYVREAAALYDDRLERPDLAIPVLEEGVRLAPDDAQLKAQLATGLRVAGRLDEARALLEELVQGFGRRRSAERAAVHFQLAQVAHAAGDLDLAMEQLDLARKMDMSHAGILRMSGRMAHEAGQLERAEKAYRALLLVVRRQDPGAPDVSVGASEVLYELSLLATAAEDTAQAEELLETALSTAAQHDAEAERFVRDVLARGEVDLALRAIEMRLDAAEEPASRARMLARRAQVLAEHRDQKGEALAASLEAIELAPEEDSLHARTRALAKELEAIARYAEVLSRLAEKSRRKEEAPFASDLLMRLGEVTETDLVDLEGAAELYAKVEALGVRKVPAWQALARVADARGDGAEEVRVLRQLMEAEDADVPPDARTRALYRIAEVELGGGATEDGLDTLRRALDREPRYVRAGAILQAAAEHSPEDDAVLAVYEEVARAAGDPAMVLDYLERRARRPDATLEIIREGLERADILEAPERAEKLLERGLELAGALEYGLADALWVAIGLAERRQAAGDIPGAITHMRSAAEATEGMEAFELWMKVAALAAEPGGDLTLAAETYRHLLGNDPTNRDLWEPLVGVYAKLEDRDGLEAVVQSTLDALLDPADRNALRMKLAGFLLEVEKAEDEAVAVLEHVLDEDPDHAEAGALLSDLFEKRGDASRLVDLLHRRLDRARDRQDVETIAALSLKMGKLIEPEDRERAIDLYRAGLDWAPEDGALLSAVLNLQQEEQDVRERGELMERLLAVSSGEEASRTAAELMELYASIGDDYGVARALDLGFKACPSDTSLRDRLEAYYREREEHTELAEMIAFDAAHREDAAESVARFREAAVIQRETLANPAKAAEVMRAAWERAPEDLSILEALVKDLSESGLHAAASEDVARALEHQPDPEGPRAHLLRMRAHLEGSVGNLAPAIADLEEAYRIDPAGSIEALLSALDAERHAAADRGDIESERGATQRLASLLSAHEQAERGRDVLAEWVERDPTDGDALRELRRIDLAAERFDEVARHEARLVEIEEGEAQVEAALGLLAACRQVGHPEAARPGLEHAHAAQPASVPLRDALRGLYEEIGAHRELAEVLLGDAEASEDEEARFECLRRAGELLVAVGDPEAAMGPLSRAAAIKPDDHDLAIALSDAYIASSRLQEAVELLQEAIGTFKRRRSPHLAAMQLRMARIAGFSGDPETQKEWLGVALDADKNNGEVAAELAELAMHLGDDDAALKALRVVTLQKTPGPMSKAVAFLRQAQIAHRQGDGQKAVLWARRARLEDDSLEDAQAFLESIGES